MELRLNNDSELIAYLGVAAVGNAGRKFEHAFGTAMTPPRAPRRYGVVDANNTVFFVEVDDINGDGHEHAMDAAAGINEQSVAVGQFFATDQPDEASPEGVGDGADGDEVGLCSWVINV